MAHEAGIVIVGAGPVGLTAALLLARNHVPCVVLDKRPAPELRDPSVPLRAEFCNGSRAVVTQRSSLRVWDQAEPAIARRLCGIGVTWQRKETWWGTRRLFTEDYIPVSASDPAAVVEHPAFLNVPQPTVERALLDAAMSHSPDLLRLQWNTEVTGLRQSDEWVSLETSQGPMKGSWVIAADGPRSTMRDLLDIDMPRATSRNWFVIADVRDPESRFPFGPTTRRFTYAPPGDPRGQLLAMPQPDGVWRLDWQSATRLDLDAEQRSGRLEARLRTALDGAPYTIEWLSQYRFENSVADRFHVRRVVLAGDAAHRLSPFGGRGLNSGVTDAAAAAAVLVHGTTEGAGRTRAALARYGEDRRAAAIENVAATSRALRVMEPATAWDRAARRVSLVVAPWSARARRHLDTGPYIREPGGT